jgi:flagellar biosynthesis protein FlhF
VLQKRTAPTSAEAMKLITDEFGPDVVIVSTVQGDDGVSVFFAPAAPEVQEPTAVAQDLAREVAQLKSLVQQQFSQMSWQNWSSGDPRRGRIWQDLQDLGFSPLVARTLVDALPEGLDAQQSSAWVIEAITHQLSEFQPNVEMIQRGGVYAVVGPTGSGKTTTIAKIAARCMALKDKSSVALITTDTYRICAIDQLRTYGKVIGVPVHVALNADELSSHLKALSDKHLVLIDTMGLSPRDVEITEQIGLLDRHDIQKILVMNVASQPRALSEVAERFRGNGFYGAVLTKLDECSYVAGSIDLALREKLNLIYMSTGQRVPEDLYLADPHFLVQRAMRKHYEQAYARTEEELQWLRYGISNQAVGDDIRRV